MPEGVRFKLDGFSQLSSSLHSAADDLAHMDRANAVASDIVTADARGRAPRLTGALAASIAAAPESDGAAVVATVAYAGVIEFGSPRRNIAAQPYMRPAVEATEQQYMTTYTDEVQTVLNRVRGA